MKRSIVLGTLLAIGGLSIGVSAVSLAVAGCTLLSACGAGDGGSQVASLPPPPPPVTSPAAVTPVFMSASTGPGDSLLEVARRSTSVLVGAGGRRFDRSSVGGLFMGGRHGYRSSPDGGNQ